MKVKYTIKYKRGTKPRSVTGFIRIPKDLPEGFTDSEAVEFLIAKHNLQDSHPLEIRFPHFTNKNFKYDNAKQVGRG